MRLRTDRNRLVVNAMHRPDHSGKARRAEPTRKQSSRHAMPRRFLARRLGTTGLLVVVAVMVGCERKKVVPGQVAGSTKKIDVAATVYPLADVARQVGGSDVEVTWFVESGQSLTDLGADLDVRNRL